MKKTLVATAVASALFLSGCDSDSINQGAAPNVSDIPETTVMFNPIAGELSTPTDLLMNPTTGLVSIPKAGDIYESLSSLDGWGLGSPISIGMVFPDRQYGSIKLDPTSAESAEAVVLMEQGQSTPLTYGIDYIVKTSSSGLVVIPLKPLKPSQRYLFAVTDKVQDTLGRKIEASQYYSLLSNASTDVTQLTTDPTAQAKLSAIQSAISGIDAGLTPLAGDNDIVYSGSFTTQSVGKVMQELMSDINSATPSITNVSAVADLKNFLLAAGKTEAEASAATVAHNPTISYGNLTLPYYLETPNPASNCAPATLAATKTCDGLISHFKAADGSNLGPVSGYAPNKVSDTAVKVFVSTPNGAAPAGGWPVAIYVHGITSYKETAAAIASNLAAQGIALVAIDLPLHGARSIDFNADGVYEITATDSSSGAAYVNGSPLAFANLGALQTVRDNLKQSISDILTLRRSLEGNTLNLNADNVSLLGVSLGSIISTGVLGASDSYDSNRDGTPDDDASNPFDFQAAALTVGGSQAAAIMGYSNTFGPVVKAALKNSDAFAAGVASNLGYSAQDFIALRTNEPETYSSLANVAYPAFVSSFVAGAQQVIDSSDALAWASKVKSDTPVLVTQIIGNGVNLSDQTVPNNLATSGFPLAGTTPWTSILGLSKASTTTSGASLKVYTNFMVGKHTSLLDPSAQEGITQDAASALAATTEMQTQVISFLKSGGQAVQIINSNVVE